MFDKHGVFNKKCTHDQLARYIFFTETGKVLDKKPRNSFVGKNDNVGIYLIFDGYGKDNLFDFNELKKMKEGVKKIVYADKCIIAESKLKQKNIKFKQIPYGVKTY